MKSMTLAAVALVASCASSGATTRTATTTPPPPEPVTVAEPAPAPAAPTPAPPVARVNVTQNGEPLPAPEPGAAVTRVRVTTPRDTAALQAAEERAREAERQSAEAERQRDEAAQQSAEAERQRDEAAQRAAEAEAKAHEEAAARQEAEQRAGDLERQLATLAGVRETERGLVVTLSGDVIFEFDRAALLPPAEEKLARLADVLKSTDRKLSIEGHTDAVGGDDYNQELSYRRAGAVRDYLLARGVPAERMEVHGFGERSPVAGNGSPEGRAMNRRVEIIILKP